MRSSTPTPRPTVRATPGFLPPSQSQLLRCCDPTCPSWPQLRPLLQEAFQDHAARPPPRCLWGPLSVILFQACAFLRIPRPLGLVVSRRDVGWRLGLGEVS